MSNPNVEMTASPMPDPANVPSSRWREWLTPGLLLPVGSGVALVTGFLTELAGLSTVATPAFWAGILLGGYTFVPGASHDDLGDRRNYPRLPRGSRSTRFPLLHR